MSVYVKCVCPSCFEEIFLGECAIMSGVAIGTTLKPGSKGIRARMNVEPLDGNKYTRELAHRACTNCGYLLPHNIESVPSIRLAVVGDTFSGKSHFIAALIQQLKTEWLNNNSGFGRLECLTQTVEKKYATEYIQRLFVNNMILNPTVPGNNPNAKAEPLIYTLSISSPQRHSPVQANLMIYDTSGEDFEDQARLVQMGQFALNTNALIFVVDPFTITPLFRQLPAPLQTLLQTEFMRAQKHRAVDNISTVLPIFERFHKQTRGANLAGIPIAVMLSKADLFTPIYRPPNTYRFQSNPTYTEELDLNDITTVDAEVKGLLSQYGEGALLAATRQIKDVKFFATSATGKPPDARGQFLNVKPCRCLDPVLWLFYKLGIIKGYGR